MSLPYPSLSWVPGDILPAADLNNLMTNIASLSDGTGLNANSITSEKIDFTTVSTATDANGWSKTIIPGATLYAKNLGSASTTGATTQAMESNVPVDESYTGIYQYLVLQARTGSATAGAANNIVTVPRAMVDDSKFQVLYTTTLASSFGIHAIIIKPVVS